MKYRDTALDAVIKAARVCMAVQDQLIDVANKADRSPVTVADFAAQAIVSELLHEAFPDIPLIGEEDAQTLRETEDICTKVVSVVQQVLPHLKRDEILAAIDRGTYQGGAKGIHWTLDPIDGTKGFLRREQYAVALALIKDGEVIFGVLACPNMPHDLADPSQGTGSLFYAAKESQTFFRPLFGNKDTVVSVKEKPFRFCESVEKSHSSHSLSAQIARAAGIKEAPIRMDSQAKYALVAQGQAAIYMRMPTRADYVEKIWDHAAGWIVITRAGGVVTDIDGKELDFSCGRRLENNRGILATCGQNVHEKLLSIISQLST
ncbi:MAG: 3'(2'),5'-bisphosphate nucleotidase [Myxococcota bacterium]|nr:3'(2'),5'-bisphosphate nucleotidase [Myxococcota bacterium]